jgi:predicted metal-binding protein
MPELKTVDDLIKAHNPTDYKWIDPKTIIVAQWVRMKCTYGCSGYGKSGCCPPHTPSIAECERFFKEYSHGVVTRYEKQFDEPKQRHAWTKKKYMEQLDLERGVFLAGHHKAFMLSFTSCSLCKECSGNRTDCKQQFMARPSPEAMGIDVYGTVRQYGLPIEVRTDKTQVMNRYGFLLVE